MAWRWHLWMHNGQQMILKVMVSFRSREEIIPILVAILFNLLACCLSKTIDKSKAAEDEQIDDLSHTSFIKGD